MTVQEIEKKIGPLIKRSAATRFALFGSAVRGEMSPSSDIDFLIELPDPNISLLDFVDLKLKLEEALGRSIDLVEYKMLKPRLRDTILREQIILYEKGSESVSR